MNLIGDEENDNIREFEIDRNDRKIEAETPIEFNQYMIEPTGEKFFYWITKDITLTYLDEGDIDKVRMLCEIIVTLHLRGLHENAMEFFGDLTAIVNTARAKHGFERQMEQTNIGKTFQYFDEEESKKVNRGE